MIVLNSSYNVCENEMKNEEEMKPNFRLYFNKTFSRQGNQHNQNATITTTVQCSYKKKETFPLASLSFVRGFVRVPMFGQVSMSSP